MTETTMRRGRPRPQETIERDRAAGKLLASGPMTRNQLRDALGGTTQDSTTYLALCRLRHAGLVERVRQESGGFVWKLTARGESEFAQAA